MNEKTIVLMLAVLILWLGYGCPAQAQQPSSETLSFAVSDGIMVRVDYDLQELEQQAADLHKQISENKSRQGIHTDDDDTQDLDRFLSQFNWSFLGNETEEMLAVGPGPIVSEQQVPWEWDGPSITGTPLNNLRAQLLEARRAKRRRQKTNDVLAELVAQQLKAYAGKWQPPHTVVISLSVAGASSLHLDSLALPTPDTMLVQEAVYRIYHQDELIFTGYYTQPYNRAGSSAELRSGQDIHHSARSITKDIVRQLKRLKLK
jgi:hypothetical protein